MNSTIKRELKWKYRKEKFLAITESGTETIWTMFSFALLAWVVAFFMTHIAVYLADAQHPQSPFPTVIYTHNQK